MQNFVFREKVTMKKAEKTPETLRFSGVFLVPYYTIPKIKRELKLHILPIRRPHNYTIPKIKRELKLASCISCKVLHYTIPKIKRELKPSMARNELANNYTIPKIKRELKLNT